MSTWLIRDLFCLALAAGCWAGAFDAASAAESQLLWHIGTLDNSDAEFALAHGDYAKFLENFGSPDHAFYIGLSSPQTDWPCVLPGIVDRWAGSSVSYPRHLWDQMNTLPIGFVLNQASASGQCVFSINFCDAAPKQPPRLRVTVNAAIFERELLPGGSVASLKGNFKAAKKQRAEIEFPASLLKPGYNEIALRTTDGSWCVFDSLSLQVPAGVSLAPVGQTVIRSVAAASYAVSPTAPATVRVEVFRKDSPGTLDIQIGNEKVQEVALQPGLQVLEIPAPASPQGPRTHLRLSAEGRLLEEADLELPASPPVTPADYVSVFMGTAHSRWMIAPGPWMPFGMVKIAPDNQPQSWCAGYDYRQEYIDCFSHIHEWTMAGLGMMPTVGPLRTHPGLDETGYSSRFDKTSERGGIGFYEVFLKDSGIKVELTATTRATLQRYTFPASEQARVLIPFLLQNEYEMHVLSAKVRRSGNNEIEGIIQTDVPYTDVPYIFGTPGRQHFYLHFVSQFNRDFDSLGGWQNVGGPFVTIKWGASRPVEEAGDWHGGEVISNAQDLAFSGDCGAFVNFKTAKGEAVEVRTAISLVSLEDARLNLEQELAGPFGWNFAAVVQNQRRAWNELFSRVEIETPNAREKTRFYSNFYRTFTGRNIWSDVNGQWADPDGHAQKLTDPDAVMLGCDALWTTFWNLNQVMNLVTPEWSARWVKSELELYDKCGWLAKGPAGLKYISIMVAEHEIPLLVAAHQAGIKGLDAKKILAAAVKMQTTLPEDVMGGGRAGNENLEGYLKYGYVPADGPLKGKISNTCEYAYDDWTVAQLALALGHKDLAKKFLDRSHNWRNAFDETVGFIRPRLANGERVTPFDPFRTRDYVEGNAWQYTWFVPQAVPDLVAALGRERFISRLNEGFEKSAPMRFNSGYVDQGNQPTMHVAWLFNWAGQPWLSQKWTHAILDAYYGFNPADAYLGDEDQGQMSAWFVMSSLGLFQTDGGCRVNPIYEIGSPLYPKATVHLSKKYYGGKTFTITARNASFANRYIQSATFNGKPLNQWWIRQKDVIQGGDLVLELGPTPNKDWAAGCPLPDH